jgi:hypothetical protein
VKVFARGVEADGDFGTHDAQLEAMTLLARWTGAWRGRVAKGIEDHFRHLARVIEATLATRHP